YTLRNPSSNATPGARRWFAIRPRLFVRNRLLLQDIGVDVVSHDVVALHVDGQRAGKTQLSEPQEANFHRCAPSNVWRGNGYGFAHGRRSLVPAFRPLLREGLSRLRGLID